MTHASLARSGQRAVLGLVLWLAAGIPLRAHAEEARPSAELRTQMTGQFVLAEPRAAVEARLAAVVDQAAASVSFLIRPIARSRLGRVVVFCTEYRLALSESDVSVICDTRAPIERKLDNSGGKVAGLDEEPVDVTVAVAPSSVALTFKAGDGERTTRYRFDGNGGMEVAVRIVSPQIEQPLEWSIRYRRAASASAR
jgi:hypothetical protein